MGAKRLRDKSTGSKSMVAKSMDEVVSSISLVPGRPQARALARARALSGEREQLIQASAASQVDKPDLSSDDMASPLSDEIRALSKPQAARNTKAAHKTNEYGSANTAHKTNAISNINEYGSTNTARKSQDARKSNARGTTSAPRKPYLHESTSVHSDSVDSGTQRHSRSWWQRQFGPDSLQTTSLNELLSGFGLASKENDLLSPAEQEAYAQYDDESPALAPHRWQQSHITPQSESPYFGCKRAPVSAYSRRRIAARNKSAYTPDAPLEAIDIDSEQEVASISHYNAGSADNASYAGNSEAAFAEQAYADTASNLANDSEDSLASVSDDYVASDSEDSLAFDTAYSSILAHSNSDYEFTYSYGYQAPDDDLGERSRRLLRPLRRKPPRAAMPRQDYQSRPSASPSYGGITNPRDNRTSISRDNRIANPKLSRSHASASAHTATTTSLNNASFTVGTAVTNSNTHTAITTAMTTASTLETTPVSTPVSSQLSSQASSQASVTVAHEELVGAVELSPADPQAASASTVASSADATVATTIPDNSAVAPATAISASTAVAADAELSTAVDAERSTLSPTQRAHLEKMRQLIKSPSQISSLLSAARAADSNATSSINATSSGKAKSGALQGNSSLPQTGELLHGLRDAQDAPVVQDMGATRVAQQDDSDAADHAQSFSASRGAVGLSGGQRDACNDRSTHGASDSGNTCSSSDVTGYGSTGSSSDATDAHSTSSTGISSNETTFHSNGFTSSFSRISGSCNTSDISGTSGTRSIRQERQATGTRGTGAASSGTRGSETPGTRARGTGAPGTGAPGTRRPGAGWGQRLAPDQLDDSVENALNYMVNLLSGREYAAAELKSKTMRRFTATAAELALAQCQERGYQSEERYAGMLVRHMKYALAGPLKLALIAKQKTVDPELIEAAIESEEVDWDELAYESLTKKYRTTNLDFELRRKAMAYLARRGFSASSCINAMERYQHELAERQDANPEVSYLEDRKSEITPELLGAGGDTDVDADDADATDADADDADVDATSATLAVASLAKNKAKLGAKLEAKLAKARVQQQEKFAQVREKQGKKRAQAQAKALAKAKAKLEAARAQQQGMYPGDESLITDDEVKVEQAYACLKKKYQGAPLDVATKRKAIGLLARRSFSADICFKALERYQQEHTAAAERGTEDISADYEEENAYAYVSDYTDESWD